ncbi:MAG: hypothetical protein IPG10_20590 [Flavobacteriales bacterium]|nr:hypothetical protein [Flavobacteriales bacterium]
MASTSRGLITVSVFCGPCGSHPRFGASAASNAELSGEWEVHFSPGTTDAYDALGLFQQKDGRVTGTFGTETGDYRFLEGVLDGDSLKLSCFDGSRAFLFKAVLRNDSLLGPLLERHPLAGALARGAPIHVPLARSDSLTFLKEGYDMVDFSFPSIDGDRFRPKTRAMRATS